MAHVRQNEEAMGSQHALPYSEKTVPFFRPSIGDLEIAAAVESLRSGWLTTGPNAAAFEAEFAHYLGGDVFALTTNSATAALHLALAVHDVGPGDQVILPTLTFTATAEVVRHMGAVPVFVDIDPATLCMSPDLVKNAITTRTKVIMPVHFAGRSCDMTALREIADQHGLVIVDDAAHALPTYHKGQLIGSRSIGADATAFSFYANKTMTTGEGGMLVLRDKSLEARARKMRLHGIDRSEKSSGIYDVVDVGFKYNLPDAAAAIGRVQLTRLEDFTCRRTKLAINYDRAFADLPLVLPPRAAAGDGHSWHLYTIQLAADAIIGRDDFVRSLNSYGIETSLHYRPLHHMTYWQKFAVGQQFEAADRYFEKCVSLPLFMSMSEDEQTRVFNAVRTILTK